MHRMSQKMKRRRKQTLCLAHPGRLIAPQDTKGAAAPELASCPNALPAGGSGAHAFLSFCSLYKGKLVTQAFPGRQNENISTLV